MGALVKTSDKLSQAVERTPGFLRKNNIRFPVTPTTIRKKEEAVSQVSTYVALDHQTSPQHKTLKKPGTEAPPNPSPPERAAFHHKKIVSKKSKDIVPIFRLPNAWEKCRPWLVLCQPLSPEREGSPSWRETLVLPAKLCDPE